MNCPGCDCDMVAIPKYRTWNRKHIYYYCEPCEILYEYKQDVGMLELYDWFRRKHMDLADIQHIDKHLIYVSKW
jgi:hypothetical protein